ncbi:ABC transporter ATP-binding protein [Glycomyces luteolus]|uniref:ABC transporter ATP-binding protein n=1 Tax=Glycomyces luteolus TaxID=2670330 RepID=A0A9X3PCF0_9ACTN|nr:ABC transporter ATP-binding protein [Glycomyces luteolus]MDA1362718.1 ABC transporter ATP-binding protein [Glycomyces luteolus]
MTNISKYARLLASLLGICLRREPAVTAFLLAAMAVNAVAFAGIGLALKYTVDSMAAGAAVSAAIGGVLAALAYAADRTVSGAASAMRFHVMEKVGHIEIEPGIMRASAELPEIDHLEHQEYLDRITAIRGRSWAIVGSAWNAVEAVSMGVRLILTLLILGAASPWLLLMLPCVVLQLWFDRRAQVRLKRSELVAARNQRAQIHFFKLCISGSAGKELRVSGVGPQLVDRQVAAAEQVRASRSRALIASGCWRAVGWTVFTVGYASVIGLVAVQVADGAASVGDVMMAVTIGALLRGVLDRALQSTSDASGAARVLEPYLWLREYAERRGLSRTDVPAPRRLTDGITLSNLTFSYPGTDRNAVDDLSVTLPAGAVVAVVGEYGSGKTTLVKLLAKLHRPHSGRILVDGDDLAEIDTVAWRESLSAAFQDFGRYQTTFAESIGLGDLRHGTAASLDAAVTAADADELRSRLPDGDRTQLGSAFGGIDLSEGQWQKVALARACMRPEPVVLLLDEPTASLDAPSEQAVFESYMDRAKSLGRSIGAVTVIVSHRFSTVAGADLILVMKEGALIESGDHDELMRSGGLYKELFEIHSASYLGAGK